MKIAFAKPAIPTQGCAIVALAEGAKLSGAAAALDKKTKGAISRAISAGAFVPKREKTLVIAGPAGTKLSKIVVIGLGDAGSVETKAAEKIGAIAYDQAASESAATVILPAGNGTKLGSDTKGAATVAAHLACGAALKAYRFDKYRTKEDKDAKPKLKSLTVVTDAHVEAKRLYGPLAALVEGVKFTRDLVSEPANVLYPESFVARCLPLKKDGLQIEVLGVKEMQRLGMGALLGVGQGSAKESRLLVMRWMGARDKNARPLALVGKGVCFDTGG
ncbi:MAG: leucyl aminopeptidase, partial [Rhodobacteraceae bacterium]|nr:leucyl aminopeptidase [Paracoccaceae bacterium]